MAQAGVDCFLCKIRFRSRKANATLCTFNAPDFSGTYSWPQVVPLHSRSEVHWYSIGDLKWNGKQAVGCLDSMYGTWGLAKDTLPGSSCDMMVLRVDLKKRGKCHWTFNPWKHMYIDETKLRDHPCHSSVNHNATGARILKLLSPCLPQVSSYHQFCRKISNGIYPAIRLSPWGWKSNFLKG